VGTFFHFCINISNYGVQENQEEIFECTLSEKQTLLLIKPESGVSMSDFQKYSLAFDTKGTSCYARGGPWEHTASETYGLRQCCDEMLCTGVFMQY
jgi:hypothetical protein